jgi:hypothetical protein
MTSIWLIDVIAQGAYDSNMTPRLGGDVIGIAGATLTTLLPALRFGSSTGLPSRTGR